MGELSPMPPLSHSPTSFLASTSPFEYHFGRLSKLILLMCNAAPAKGRGLNRTFQLSQDCNSHMNIHGSVISGPPVSSDR